MIIVNLILLININICFSVYDEKKIANRGWLFASEYQFRKYGIL